MFDLPDSPGARSETRTAVKNAAVVCLIVTGAALLLAAAVALFTR